MKPLHLTMRAFGPYADEQEIDLAAVCARELFLIHGPTGGGKTTILDAICFALYGDTTGDRSGEQMRCQIADAKTPTEVEMLFAIGAKKYRVKRSPKQKKPKRGGGLTDAAATATIWELTPDGESPLASGANDVTARVNALLGFSLEQFRQVIMLPQGKFRELLLARSEQREEILQALFGTHFYELLQEALTNASNDVLRKLEDQSKRQELLLQQAGVENVEALREALKAKGLELEAQRAAVEETSKLAQRAQAQLVEAKGIAEKISECEQAEGAAKTLQEQLPQMQESQRLISSAERAQKLAPLEQDCRQRKAEVGSRDLAAKSAQATRVKAQDVAQLATKRLEQAKSAIEAAKEHQQRLGKLRALQPLIRRLIDAERDVITREASLAKAGNALNGCRAEQQVNSAGKARTAAELVKLRELSAQMPGRVQLAKEAQRQLTARQALDSLLPKLAGANRKIIGAQQRQEMSDTAVRDAKAASFDLMLAWKNSSAARLAGTLLPGAACPVCGSCEHPLPAVSSGPIPSETTLKSAEEAVSRAEEDQRKLTKELTHLRSELAELAAQQEGHKAALAGCDASAGALQEKCVAAQRAVKAAEDAQRKLPAVEEQEKELARVLEELEKRSGALVTEVQAASNALTAARTTRDECLGGLPDQLRTQEAWEAEVARLEGLVSAAEKELSAAESAGSSASAALAGAQELEQQAQSELEQARRLAAEAMQALEAGLAEQGFASVNEYSAAKMTDVQVRGHREWIEQTRKAINEADGRLKRARDIAGGLSRPDLSALEAASGLAQQASKQAIQTKSNLEAEANRLCVLEEQLRDTAIKFAALEREYQVIGKVAKSSTGENPKRLKFHRFVLGFLLDDVLWAASQRLKVMSRARYQMQRVRDVKDGRRLEGLELEVFDAHTGQSRPVATLSGGESFQASLSLSLGLADVVQNRAGGIRMDTMFIDEGFGSLDAEALDEAMNAIRDLQKSGRVVGIISHVPELRQLVSARIEITTNGRGSSAHVHCL